MAKIKGKKLSQVTDASMYRHPYQNMSLVDMVGEIWKPVPDFEEYYMASNQGRIKRLARQVYNSAGNPVRSLKERIVKQSVIGQPGAQFEKHRRQLSFTATTVGRTSCLMTSRTVYSAFIGRLDEIEKDKFVILHRDSDSLNNRIENLYLATRKELAARNYKEGIGIPFELPWVREKNTALKRKKISQYSLHGDFIRSFPSISEAEKQTGISKICIGRVSREKQKHAGGYIWRFDTKVQKLDARAMSVYSNPTQVVISQYDMQDRLVGSHKNVRRASQHMNYSESEYKRLKELLRRNGGTTFFKGYTWKYATL